MKTITCFQKYFFALLIMGAIFSFESVNAQLNNAQMLALGSGGNQGYGSTSYRAGVVNGRVGTDTAFFYCHDLFRNVSLPDTNYRDSSVTLSHQLAFILYHYYPNRPLPYPNGLSANNEAASVQFAIWHFTNGISIDSIDNNTIRNRTRNIVDSANFWGPSVTIPLNLTIVPDFGDDFYVSAVDAQNVGVNGVNMQLSITGGGTLSSYNSTTGANGHTPNVTVTSGAQGDTIYALADNGIVTLGTIFVNNNHSKQSFILAKSTRGKIKAKYVLDGALPVELSSFTSSISGNNVNLNWVTSSENNNSGFGIERKSINETSWRNIGNVSGNGTSTSTHYYTYTDKNLASGTYQYRLKQTDYNGNFEYHNLNSEIEVGAPVSFALNQNYPNPFNPSTKINYQIPEAGLVSIKIFDMLGREVASLVNEVKTAGYYTVDFNASNLSSGLYYYRMEAPGFSKIMKMSLVK